MTYKSRFGEPFFEFLTFFEPSTHARVACGSTSPLLSYPEGRTRRGRIPFEDKADDDTRGAPFRLRRNPCLSRMLPSRFDLANRLTCLPDVDIVGKQNTGLEGPSDPKTDRVTDRGFYSSSKMEAKYEHARSFH